MAFARTMKRYCQISLGLIFIASLAYAGTYNKTLSIGDAAPTWKNLVGTDGKQHSLADLADKDVIVVCFTCNTCPYAVDYEDRLIALAKKFAAEGNRCALVAINANKVKDDLLPAMEERAKTKGFNFFYLHDETQQVARSFGATFTPEFVVLNKDRKVVYLGAMDDSPDGKSVTKRFVEDGVAAALAGNLPAVKETPAVGCAVRYVRERK
jgi:thiol-disulfide isomerase/thioredoxin